MSLYSKQLVRLVRQWPGKKRLGMYRFLPLFFIMGGAIEWFMIHANIAPGGETFFQMTSIAEGKLKDSTRRNSTQIKRPHSQLGNLHTTEFCKNKTLLSEFGALVNSLCNNYILGLLRKKVPETLLFIVERLVQRDSMPAGVDWFPYLHVAFASFLSAAAGAQVVHLYYKPDLSVALALCRLLPSDPLVKSARQTARLDRASQRKRTEPVLAEWR